MPRKTPQVKRGFKCKAMPRGFKKDGSYAGRVFLKGNHPRTEFKKGDKGYWLDKTRGGMGKEEIKCKNCGMVFKDYIYDKRKFCSSKCCYEWRKSAWKGRIFGKGKPKNRKTSICIECGKEFEHWVGTERKYCSNDCKRKNHQVLSKCPYCGKNYWSPKAFRKKYCSRKCYDLHLRELQKGENSHFWEGGKTKLNDLERNGAKYSEWRSRVFKYDNYICWICGGGGGKLQAHHLKDWFNYPELRYDIRNGLTLCKICHQIYTKFKNKKKLGELSVLGRQIKEVKTN